MSASTPAFLIGRKITGIKYLDEAQARDNYLCHRPLILVLDDGSELDVQSDDEGNGGGTLVHYFHDENGKQKKQYYCPGEFLRLDLLG